MAELAAELASLVPGSSAESVAPNRVRVSVPAGNAPAVAAQIASHRAVTWIERQAKMRLLGAQPRGGMGGFSM
jgi:hypothetical protein